MVWPIIPIGIAVLGTAAGVGLASFLGIGGKKDQDVAAGVGDEIHAPYEHYAPVDSRAYTDVFAPHTINVIDSPYANASTRQDLDASAEARADPISLDYDGGKKPSAAAGIAEGTNLEGLALLGVVGLVVYGVVTKV